MLIKILMINPFYSKTQNILKCIKWYTETYGIEQFETAGNVPFGTAGSVPFETAGNVPFGTGFGRVVLFSVHSGFGCYSIIRLKTSPIHTYW